MSWLAQRLGGVLGTLLRTTPRVENPFARILPAIFVFAAYYLGAKLGLALTFHPHPVSVMWPPNSILLSALLLTSPRSWWTILLAAFPAHLLAELQGDVPLRMILCW